MPKAASVIPYPTAYFWLEPERNKVSLKAAHIAFIFMNAKPTILMSTNPCPKREILVSP